MNKYKGYLLCTDMDGTLLNAEHEISKENQEAIEYFISEGGKFTVATGRTPVAITPIFKRLKPNAPIVTHNGAAVYDLDNDKYLAAFPLDSNAIEVLKYVEEAFGYVGFEIYDYSKIYFYKVNESVQWHIGVENLSLVEKDYREIPRPWTKVMFVQTKEEAFELREHLMKTKYWKDYYFIKSSSRFLELLGKDATKGNALSKMKGMLNDEIHTTICVGDNENDISLLKAADISYAVENAIDELKKVANHITVRNTEHAIAEIINNMNL